MDEYTIAEAYVLENGLVRYIVEYVREGQGVQRPTFDLHPDLSFDEAAVIMRESIAAERALNESPPVEPVVTPPEITDTIGLTF